VSDLLCPVPLPFCSGGSSHSRFQSAASLVPGNTVQHWVRKSLVHRNPACHSLGCQNCKSLSEILQQTSSLLLDPCLQQLAWCQPAQSSCKQPMHWQVGQGRQELLLRMFFLCVWGLCWDSRKTPCSVLFLLWSVG